MPEISFDFLEEVQKPHNFNALFPDEKAMKAILWLYAKVKADAFPAGKFKETDIYNAILETNRSVNYSRLPQEYFNSLISPLLNYFLLYNEQEKIYSFRDYGKMVCKHAEETLSGNFNPTNIEIICKELLRALRDVNSKDTLWTWLELNFDVFEPKMSSQVDYLDRKIDTTVLEIRESAQLQKGDVLETLEKVDTYLEEIRGYNRELRYAFLALNDINTELEKHIDKADENKILDKFSRVQEFFPDVRYRLDLIDKRLDKLQPRFRQFFGALNKPLFNTRVETFLRFLLTSSSIQTEGVRKTIQFPINMPLVRIRTPTSRFIIVERKEDLFPAISRKRQDYGEDAGKRQSAFQKLNEKILQQDTIAKWVSDILKDCKKQGVLWYSGYFMTMIDQQNGNIDLAARVTHRLLKISSFHQEITMTVDKNTPIEYKNIKIWEARIVHL